MVELHTSRSSFGALSQNVHSKSTYGDRFTTSGCSLIISNRECYCPILQPHREAQMPIVCQWGISWGLDIQNFHPCICPQMYSKLSFLLLWLAGVIYVSKKYFKRTKHLISPSMHMYSNAYFTLFPVSKRHVACSVHLWLEGSSNLRYLIAIARLGW